MASTQRPTRRSSARHENDADDAPPAKKQKVEKAPTRAPAKQTNGKKAPSAAKPNNNGAISPPNPDSATIDMRDIDAKVETFANRATVYESDEDLFAYRRKDKKTKKPQSTPATIPEDELAPEPAPEQPAPKPRGRKRASDSVEANKPDAQAKEPTRKSKRLSAETSQEKASQPELDQAEAQRGREKERPPKAAKTPQQDDGLRVERKRKDTKIALPFADTPVIQRNKEMRQTSAENRRRSSSTMRGRRASSLIDSGTSNAVPHQNVPVAEFYKHISNDLPEPRRMKQLLTWCGSRALTERPGENFKGDVNAILAARAIQDELLKDFTNRSDMSDWFSREEEVKPAVLVKKPNPRNVQNASKLQELEAEVQRLEREKGQWDKLLSGLSSSLETEIAATKESQPIDSSKLDQTQVEYTNVLTAAESSAGGKARGRLKQASSALEFKIDTFADGVHRLTMLNEVARESAEGVMADASHSLQQRQDDEKARSGSSKESVGDVLRAFSRTSG